MSRQSCIVCYTVPSNILTLQCDHNLCISCSSRVCNETTLSITCPACRYCTYLDEDIINQLSSIEDQKQHQNIRKTKNDQFSYQYPLYNKKGNKNSNKFGQKKNNKQNEHFFNHKHNYDYRKNSLNSENNQSYHDLSDKQKRYKAVLNESMPKDIYNQPKSTLQAVLYCKQHSQYQTMYVCQDCDNCFICPECVIHGHHKNHQVETVKRTISKIQAQISSKVYSLDCSIEGLVKASQDKKRTLKSKIQQINRLKEQALQKYKLMREELAKQQRQIINKCTNLVTSFQQDFSQIQQWIKNDLILIQKEKNYLNNIVNPINNTKANSKSKKSAIEANKLIEIRIIQEYLNHLKRNDNDSSKKYMWISNKINQSELHQEIQQNLQVLTDRIQRIKPLSINQMIKFNHMETKQHSLAASRQKQNSINISKKSQIKPPSKSKLAYIESPFNNLKATFEKQGRSSQVSSNTFIPKNSRLKDTRMLKKSTFICEDQNNFLIF